MKRLPILCILVCLSGLSLACHPTADDTSSDSDEQDIPIHSGSMDRFPLPVIPDCIGVCVHWIDPEGEPYYAEDVRLLEESGVGLVRKDLLWEQVEEVEKGVYDYWYYDYFVNTMKDLDIHIHFTFCYGNPFYDSGLAPYTSAGRAGFTAFVDDALKRYKNDVAVWEIWNEPESSEYWKPESDPADYTRLVNAVSTTIKQNNPPGALVAQGGAYWSTDFSHEIGGLGAFSRLDAVSIHPYQDPGFYPEDVIDHYTRMQSVFDRYYKNIPIINSEWGFASTDSGLRPAGDEEGQAAFLVRSFLFSLGIGRHYTIWYCWLEDNTPDIPEEERHFGLMTADRTPKKAYYALQTLTGTLGGYSFTQWFRGPDGEVLALLFSDGTDEIVVVWRKTGTGAVSIDYRHEGYTVLNLYGVQTEAIGAGDAIEHTVAEAPQYLLLE